jgi:2-keto-4-pentenoate hydratase/2-oxohepta-3-ene-1,7-dioic acid hydratase in catechol pathway
MRIILILIGLAILIGGALMGTAIYVSKPVFDERLAEAPESAFDILPVSEALTFARTTDGSLLLVVGADRDSVDAIDLSAVLDPSVTDPSANAPSANAPSANAPLALLRSFGYQALAAAAGHTSRQVPLAQLGMPFDPAYPHIAAGTNFRAHAEEVGLDDGPFLFPKLTRATAWNAPVPARSRLDYEAELCAVTLGAYTQDDPAPLGFVLCNDFTDRWSLLTEIDLGTPMGQTGFPDAKGGPGMLPIGPFLVVPRDDAGFHESLEMGLAVAGELRQRDSAGLMIWSAHEIARNALGNCETDFVSAAGNHRLTPCAAIPEATLLLTGTPAGVAFHYLNIWRPASYLRSGDEVLTYGEHLGVLLNTVE